MLDRNIEQNVVSTIRDNPDITFYIFLPPYSICWWDSLNQNGTGILQRRIWMEEYVIQKLLDYDNVRLFSFSNNFELVCDLNYYIDDVHYTDKASSKILAWMKEGKFEVTKSNYMNYIEEITDFYLNFDYDSFFNDK